MFRNRKVFAAIIFISIILVLLLLFLSQPIVFFSKSSGVYSEPFELRLYATKGDIYYTTDGSIPSIDSNKYSGPISLTELNDECYVIRAIAVSNSSCSSVETATYFVGKDAQAKLSGKNIVSIVFENEDLFGDNGIGVAGIEYNNWVKNGEKGDKPVPNYEKHGIEYEIPVCFSYLSKELSFSQNIGLRIAGASTRSEANRFILYARNDYSGSEYFSRNIFDGIKSHKLTIRPAITNGIIQSLFSDRNVAIQNSKAVEVFLNGKFYESAFLLERYDEQYFHAHYGIKKNNVYILKAGVSQTDDLSAIDDWNLLFEYIDSHDLANDKNYDEFSKMVDIQSYIDYLCINIYIDNLDFDEYHNTVVWKSIKYNSHNKYEDCRWRWALYDIDCLDWKDTDYWGMPPEQKDTFSLKPRFSQCAVDEQRMFTALKKNKRFCEDFIKSFIEIANNNLNINRIENVFKDFGYDLKSDPYYFNFYENRQNYIFDYLYKEFEK